MSSNKILSPFQYNHIFDKRKITLKLIYKFVLYYLKFSIKEHYDFSINRVTFKHVKD